MYNKHQYSDPSVTVRQMTGAIFDVFWGMEWDAWLRIKIKPDGSMLILRSTKGKKLKDEILQEIRNVCWAGTQV